MSAKKAAKKAAKKTAGGTSAKKAAKKAASKTAAAGKKAAGSSPDIAKAAYLNYRSRVEQGLPGDELGDWLAAEKSPDI